MTKPQLRALFEHGSSLLKVSFVACPNALCCTVAQLLKAQHSAVMTEFLTNALQRITLPMFIIGGMVLLRNLNVNFCVGNIFYCNI